MVCKPRFLEGRVDRVVEWMDYTNQVEKVGAKGRLCSGSPMYSSISRLDNMHLSVFLLLKVWARGQERRFIGLPPDMGSFMHDCIDAFSSRIKDAGIGWEDFDREWCRQEISIIVDELLEKRMGWLINNSDRYRYLVVRLKRVVARAIWVIRSIL